ncbi:MAG: PaaX family transcriptional regulator [Candidatus Jorgensenbacteria bacterium GW2011_GWA1_48_11]|uniref:PaaX family transcriptional regulator n=1 Tax=Candidatus Jorgensenbacteria bacterium GW2011_GWA1_48_11 TaxID=1618660 RepID=A0A0G1WN09_9BACT|nr:MAG: PaaX family transcriptional regulator [Candidatus Jorgensenbacteria bacterium GW2011_GWA1_48_11]KKW12219.1 MAG: PaaX family transcriptional regulator [Candidatus Jorgensenbacteria bacterium GW2011_GWB1_49_9]
MVNFEAVGDIIKNMAKTSVDARKHIREWSRFFGEMQDVGVSLMEEFLRRHEKRKYLKQSLKRLIQKGFVYQKSDSFRLTPAGLKLFKRFSPALAPKNHGKWDGRWRLITFDIPVRLNKKRQTLRNLLKDFNFYLLQESVWVCPNILPEKFWDLLVDLEVDKYCKVMLVDILEGDEALKDYFHLPQF